jgi:hypothetical protein
MRGSVYGGGIRWRRAVAGDGDFSGAVSPRRIYAAPDRTFLVTPEKNLDAAVVYGVC